MELSTALVTAGVLVVAYLLGTFPTADLVGRRVGADPHRSGSGNPGATNVTRVAGWRAGVVVFAGDALKGAVAAALGLLVSDGALLAFLAGGAAVLGHVLPLVPPSRRLQGGKGVATWLGALAVACPPAAVVAAVVWGGVAAVGRRASLASVIAVSVAPIAVAVFGDPEGALVAAGVAVVVVVTHRSNLVRLAAGTEPHVPL